MKLISAKDAAALWNINIRSVQKYCSEGKIYGAQKIGEHWFLPTDAQKPKDRRERRFENDVRCHSIACPMILYTDIYKTPGSGDETAKLLGAETGALFAAQLQYMRGEPQTAVDAAVRLLQSCAAFEVYLGALGLICLGCMYTGNANLWREARKKIAETEYETERDKAVIDLIGVVADSSMFSGGAPDWVLKGNFDSLPTDCYPIMRFLFVKSTVIQSNSPEHIVYTTPLISQCRAEGAIAAELYLRMAAADSYHGMGEDELAERQLDRAFEIALPDGLIAPFAEYRRTLGALLDRRLRETDVKAYKQVKTLHEQLMPGWFEIYRSLNGYSIPGQELTQREYHIARFAARGLTNAEIAEKTGLSVNTVKMYVSSAIQKTYSKNRKDVFRKK